MDRAKSVARATVTSTYYFQGSAQGPDTVSFRVARRPSHSPSSRSGRHSALDRWLGHNGGPRSRGPTGTIAGQDNVDSGFAAAPASPSGVRRRQLLGRGGLEDELSTSTSGPSMTMACPAAQRRHRVCRASGVFKARPRSLCTTFSYDATATKRRSPSRGRHPGHHVQQRWADHLRPGKSSTGTTLTSFAYTYANGAYDTRLCRHKLRTMRSRRTRTPTPTTHTTI